MNDNLRYCKFSLTTCEFLKHVEGFTYKCLLDEKIIIDANNQTISGNILISDGCKFNKQPTTTSKQYVYVFDTPQNYEVLGNATKAIILNKKDVDITSFDVLKDRESGLTGKNIPISVLDKFLGGKV